MGILGVLIVLCTALVIGVIIHRIYAKQPAPSMAAATAPAMGPGAAVALPAMANRLPAGDYIKSIAAAGADLAIWVGGTDGDKVLLFNPATGGMTVAISAGQ